MRLTLLLCLSIAAFGQQTEAGKTQGWSASTTLSAASSYEDSAQIYTPSGNKVCEYKGQSFIVYDGPSCIKTINREIDSAVTSKSLQLELALRYLKLLYEQAIAKESK